MKGDFFQLGGSRFEHKGSTRSAVQIEARSADGRLELFEVRNGTRLVYRTEDGKRVVFSVSSEKGKRRIMAKLDLHP